MKRNSSQQATGISATGRQYLNAMRNEKTQRKIIAWLSTLVVASRRCQHRIALTGPAPLDFMPQAEPAG